MMIKSTRHLSFFFPLALLSSMSLPPVTTAVIPCRAAEREALLELKHTLDDPSNRLSSWVGKDCCAWQGVGCSNITAHITKLDLRNEHNYYRDNDWDIFTQRSDISTHGDKFALHGDISTVSSLQSLQHLTHLDLSSNDFSGHTIPAFFGSFARLRYLNLSYASFTGKVPEQLGNLSSLRLLDISKNYYYLRDDSYDEQPRYLYIENPAWIARLTSLRHLNMSWVKFGSASSWFEALNALPHIQDIELAICGLTGPLPHSPPHLNFTSLVTLQLGGNDINGAEPAWLYNLTSLEYLSFGSNEISWSSMHGSISRLTSLRILDLSNNSISQNFLLSLSNLCNLQVIFLDSMHNKDELYNLEMVFSGCLKDSLEELSLQHNKLSGSFPIWLENMKNLKHIDLSHNLLHGSLLVPLGSITSLQYLDLSHNNLNGTVGEGIGQLKNLIHLDLSYNSLSLSMIHLANLSSLIYLDISYNTLFISNTNDWMPPFQLQTLYMDSCKIVPRPHFPKWLQTQTALSSLSLTNARIQGTIPSWFPSSLQYLDLRNNEIGMEFIYFFPNLTILNLSNNSLSGNLSLQMVNMMPSLEYLYLSNNHLTGEMPRNFTKLKHLDLSNNLFSGHLHLQNFAKLYFLDLSNNLYSGYLPLQMRSMMPSLHKLYLSNNNFIGMVPQNFTNLRVLDLSNNLFSGHVPSQMINLMPNLEYLNLSNNNFTGEVPQNFTYLKFLDLSNNSFSGHLNPTINNTISNLRHLDLSMNNLIGSIPHSFCQMNSLDILQLSKNNFSGEIPNCWSSSLVATKFDFSNNQLDGEIPNTFCILQSIQSLHLSNNLLSGRILLCLQDCRNLVILDLGHNNFTGNIPTWSTKSLPYMRSLSLRFNSLAGNIPELSYFSCLHILDLSNNNLSGSIPISFGNFIALKGSYSCMGNGHNIDDKLLLQIKGAEHEYERSLALVNSIDLSNNGLSGNIPKVLENLHGLQNLNLSGNNLVGEIPRGIGEMQSLEILDLSRNSLSGTIPSSLANLNFLAALNLSYNNLSGGIPSDRHLQTFGLSTYTGNPYLCDPPLIRKCGKVIVKGGSREENKDDNDTKEIIWLSGSITLGFIIGFWGIFGTLLLHKRWRILYFHAVDNSYDKFYVEILVKMKRRLF